MNALIWYLLCVPYVVFTSPNPNGQLPPRSDQHHRWLTSREALLAQGFPVQKSLSGGIAACSFALDYDSDSEPQPDQVEADSERTSRIGQAGNAMHSNCIGLMVGYLLTQSQLSAASAPQPPSSASQGTTQASVVGNRDRQQGRPQQSSMNLVAAMILGKPFIKK